MKIAKRSLKLRELPLAVKLIATVLLGIIKLKHPIQSLFCYINQTSPEYIEFKDGTVFRFSSHPHDIITVFVVYFHNAYGDVPENAIVVDLGANIGVYSVYAAKMGASKVYAFEPNKEAYNVLCKNIRGNNLEGKIIPFNLAVNKEDVSVNIPVKSSPFNQICCFENKILEGYHLVPSITVDRIIDENSIKSIDILKMDCEGAEFDIVVSLTEATCRVIREIRMEYHRNPGKGLVDILMSHGFRIIRKEGYVEEGLLWLKRGPC